MKIDSHRVIITVALLFIASCSLSKTPAEKSVLEKQANREITCDSNTDCQAKWKLVQQWITSNSPYQITTLSDTIIQTERPSRLDDALAFAATKRQVENGKQDIILDIGCSNWFYCTHERLDAKVRFVNYVMGAAPLPSPAFGLKTIPVSAEMALRLHMSGVGGLIVIQVAKNSQAEKIGLRAEDVIISYDGITITLESALLDMIAKTAPTREVDMIILRNMTKQTLKLHT